MTTPYTQLSDADQQGIEASLAPSRKRRALEADHYARTMLLAQAEADGDDVTADMQRAALSSLSSRLEQDL